MWRRVGEHRARPVRRAEERESQLLGGDSFQTTRGHSQPWWGRRTASQPHPACLPRSYRPCCRPTCPCLVTAALSLQEELRARAALLSAKGALLVWGQRKAACYAHVSITDFSRSWSGGLGFSPHPCPQGPSALPALAWPETGLSFLPGGLHPLSQLLPGSGPHPAHSPSGDCSLGTGGEGAASQGPDLQSPLPFPRKPHGPGQGCL